MTQLIDPKKYGTTSMVAAKIGVGENVVRYWIKVKKLEVVKLVGGTRLIELRAARKVRNQMKKRRKSDA